MNKQIANSFPLLLEPGGQLRIEAVRQFWNQNPLYAGVSPYAPGERRFFEEHARVLLYEHGGRLDPIFTRDVFPGCKLLDVGCGIGFWVHEFCGRKASVFACDLTERAVELTCRRSELFGLSADVRQGNAEELPYEDSSFDHVNCQGVIHHTPNPEACIREFHRVLRPGGTLCFSVYYKIWPLRSRLLFRCTRALARPFVCMKGRGREDMLKVTDPEELVRLYDGAQNPIGKAYTRTQLHEMLAGCFRVLEEKRAGLPRSSFVFRIPDSVYRVLSNSFGLMIVVRCRKLTSSAELVELREGESVKSGMPLSDA